MGNAKDFSAIHKETILDILGKCYDILRIRGNDYGKDNFIDAAKIATVLQGREILPTDVAACLVGIKIARIGNLQAKSMEPLGEQLVDSYIDLVNYVLLHNRERVRLDGESEE